MKIDLQRIKVAELAKDYTDDQEGGVRGYGGKLNIRPAFQREFVYDDKKRNEVIRTLRRGFPLNSMYWAVSADGYELMDGQQRTISIARYVNNDFSVDVDGSPMFFQNLTGDKQKQILDYELFIYVCSGTESDKLEWFKTINIAGEKLTDQELRNAIYTGSWLSDAKRWFSKTSGPAYQIGGDYLNGTAIRQDYLETVLGWISGGEIEEYMGQHQHDADAQELWQYFQEVIAWVQRIFPKYRKIMKGLPWGDFYNEHKDKKFNAADLERRIAELIQDDDVQSHKGIYEYLLTGREKTLNLRTFDVKMRLKVYEKQKGICPVCTKHYELDEMEADHILPWHSGGKTELSNCQMLCKMDNRTKSGR
jgi:hypothetical protein